MHVTRVELENIKCHARFDKSFERGTTAITGENGAGKTTILEAIAWALFDTLEYSKDNFLRRGAKKGFVRVTFESDLDERQYTVYRDTANGYYVFDQGLNMRIAEKKTDVAATLRQHLGIEPGTDLRALFRSAIGVPQGTFTADFLLTPELRKKYFDRLLKVEEYREGADRLGDTAKLIGARTAEVRERIAGAEGQLARYDELVEEHKIVAARASELEVALRKLQREIAERAENVKLMGEAERRVSETHPLLERREAEREAAANLLPALRLERDAAQVALERQRAAEADHQAYLAAEDILRSLDTERIARDRLRAEASNIEGLLAAAKAHLIRLEESLERAVQAGASLAALEPEIISQKELERERDRLRDLRAQAISEGNRLTKLDAELEELRRQHTQTKERVKEAEKGRGAQERATNLEGERTHVETTLSKMEKAATSLKHLLSQRKDAAREVERLRRVTMALEKEIADLEKLSAKAAATSDLDARERELTHQLAHLRAEINRDEKFHAEVKNGLCPILSERCLNIGEGRTLDGYFTDQLQTNTAQLGALEKERAVVTVAVREAREAEKHLSKLESKRAQFTSERQLLTEREAALAVIEREITALPDAGRNRLTELQAQLSGIDLELIAVREAVNRHTHLQPLQQRLKEIEQEGKRKKEERAGVAAAAEALTALEEDITATNKELSALNNPHGRANALRQEAESASARESELAGATDAQHALEEQARSLAKRLEQYRELDMHCEKARQASDRTIEAHRKYLASEPLATTLPTRRAELEKAEEAASRAAREAEAARRDYESASQAYSRDRHDLERLELSGARERAAATGAQLEETQKQSSYRAAEITRLKKVRDDLREERRAEEKLEELNKATDFIRDTLKKAGPLVTESYLYNISIEANQLFREITGEAGRALRWTRDYEIVLEEEGFERSFQNLSGGEQMAAALSVRLALLKQLSDIRLAFFDEPTINMDAERRERLAQQIGQVRHFDQLFVISHDDTFTETVDHVVPVERADTSEAAGDNHRSAGGNDADGNGDDDGDDDAPRPRRKRARAESVAQQA